MKRLLTLLCVLPLIAVSQNIIQTTFKNGQYGVNCNMVICKPDNIPAGKKLPVLVFIPGNGEVGTDINKLYLNGPLRFIKEGVRPTGLIVVGLQPKDPWPNDLFIWNGLQKVLTIPEVDPNNIVLTGLSAGASSIFEYMRTTRNYTPVKAIIPMAIAVSTSTKEDRLKSTPAWGVGGKSDYPHGISIRDYFLKCIGLQYPWKFSFVDGAHDDNTWDRVYNPTWRENGESLYDWVMKVTGNATQGKTPDNIQVIDCSGTKVELNMTTGTFRILTQAL